MSFGPGEGERRFAVGVSGTFEVSDETPVYVISVAAQLAGMHPQTLRQYDRLGLVRPGRSGGGGRRYSLRDIHRLREVQRLSQEEGVNLAGIKRIIELENEVAALEAHVQELQAQADLARARLSWALAHTRPVLPGPVTLPGLAAPPYGLR